MDATKMIEPFTYDVSSVQERLISGGAPASGPSAAATTAVENVSKLFPNDQLKPAPNTNNSSGKSRL